MGVLLGGLPNSAWPPRCLPMQVPFLDLGVPRCSPAASPRSQPVTSSPHPLLAQRQFPLRVCTKCPGLPTPPPIMIQLLVPPSHPIHQWFPRFVPSEPDRTNAIMWSDPLKCPGWGPAPTPTSHSWSRTRRETANPDLTSVTGGEHTTTLGNCSKG